MNTSIFKQLLHCSDEVLVLYSKAGSSKSHYPQLNKAVQNLINRQVFKPSKKKCIVLAFRLDFSFLFLFFYCFSL